MSYNASRDLLSSPDPLNDSPTFSSPVKSCASKTRRSLPLPGSSPKKQTFQLDVGDQLSPQKIRVTVEAEHSEDHIYSGRRGNAGGNAPPMSSYRAPTVRQGVRTTTTTIPVRGLSDSEEDSSGSAFEKPTRGRGRPRKSVGTPIPAKSRNRAVTPAAKSSPRRRRTLGHLIDGDDSEDWDFTIGAGVEVGRGKGRSRSRSVKGVTLDKSTPATKQIPSPDKTISSATSKKGRGRRKTLTPEEIIIHEDEVDFTPDDIVKGVDGALETRGVLAQRDVNMVPTQLSNATNHPVTDTRNNDPDTPHDKFSPAKRNLTKAGQSTPRVGSAKVRSSKGTLVDVPADGTTLFLQSPLDPASSGRVRDVDKCVEDQNDENEMEEIHDFDTILESEGFSMISVDSVTSLREHLSSPLGPSQSVCESEPIAAARGTSHLQNINGAQHEDSFSSIAPEILEAATPRKKPSYPLLRAVLSANLPGDEDSFSSIPSEILEAATPGKQKLNNRLLQVKVRHSKSNDDSFSSVTPAILDAATPSRPVQTEATNSNALPRPKEDAEPDTKLTTINSVQTLETEIRALTSSGLLTPNETPSPTEMAAQQIVNLDNRNSEALSQQEPCNLSISEGSSIVNSQFKSSPPSVASRRYTYTTHAHQVQELHTNHMETPSILFSSPSLPPLIQHLPPGRSQVSSSLDPNQPSKQSISPIVRAGRVLQDIAMTSTSRSRTQSLGSPFKSPAAQRSSTASAVHHFGTSGALDKLQKSSEGSKGAGGDLFVGFSDNTRRELRRSMMMGEELARNQQRGTMGKPISLAQDEDPFQSDILSIRSPSPEEGKEYTLELPSRKPRLHVDLIKEENQFQNSLRSESAMSWQAESTVTVPLSSSDEGKTGNGNIVEAQELFQKRREAEWARKRAAVSSQIESASQGKVVIIGSDDEEDPVNISSEVDDADEDIWQAEARHSSSILKEQSSKVLPSPERIEKPRRSKIPSPWRNGSKSPAYSDGLSQLSSPQQREIIDKPSFYMHEKPESRSSEIKIRKRVSTNEAVEDEEDSPGSSIMWHIPQKSNFAPRPRNSGNLDLSALLASSPFKRPPTASHESQAPVFETSCSNVFKPSEVELAVPSLSTAPEVGPQDPNEDSLSADISLRDDSSVLSTNSSYEESELALEPSHIDSRVLYPSLPVNTPPSPQKSCLRTPTSNSATKSVAFVSPTPSPLPLSGSTWSKAHWRLLHAIYDDSKSKAGSQARGSDLDAVEPSKYLGKTIQARGSKLTLEQWHLDVVREFREEVLGWDEGVIAKRLFAIIAGEDLRRQGKRVE